MHDAISTAVQVSFFVAGSAYTCQTMCSEAWLHCCCCSCWLFHDRKRTTHKICKPECNTCCHSCCCSGWLPCCDDTCCCRLPCSEQPASAALPVPDVFLCLSDPCVQFSFYMVVFHCLSNLPLDKPLYFGVHMRFWMQVCTHTRARAHGHTQTNLQS